MDENETGNGGAGDVIKLPGPQGVPELSAASIQEHTHLLGMQAKAKTDVVMLTNQSLFTSVARMMLAINFVVSRLDELSPNDEHPEVQRDLRTLLMHEDVLLTTVREMLRA